MVTKTGNLWSFRGDHWLVIPTAIGWKRDGDAVMGAGLARKATDEFPRLAGEYGHFCKRHEDLAPLFIYYTGQLILLPTKPLDFDKPWLSWQGEPDLDCISSYVIELVALTEDDFCLAYKPRIALPLLGVDEGLRRRDVMRMLERELPKGDQYVVVEPRD